MQGSFVCSEIYDALLVASVDTLGVARLPHLLHAANLRVTLFGCPRLAVGRSRFVQHYLKTSGDPSQLLLALQRHLQETGVSYRLVILADEPLLWAAARQEDRLWMKPWFPVSLTKNAVTQITSKLDFIQRAVACDLPVPRFHLCRTMEEACSAAKDLGFPVVLKTSYGFSGSAVQYVHAPDDLVEQAREFTDNRSFLVQEFIDGPVGSTPVLFNHGHPLWWFSYLMLDSWPNRFAAASALKIIDHPDIESLLKGVGSLTGFHGIGAIDWMRDPKTGRLLLLEFNPRPTPALYLGACAGVDFSSALHGWLSGSARVWRPRSCKHDEQKVLMFPQSLYYAIDSRRLGPLFISWRDAPWNDPLLLLAHLRRCISHFLPARWKRAMKVACSRLFHPLRKGIVHLT